jgi:hypothetical protein
MAPELRRRILFILHRGLVEARMLAISGQSTQIADLADALEGLPRYLERGNADHLGSVRFKLQTYASKHPESRFEYLRYLDEHVPPKAF